MNRAAHLHAIEFADGSDASVARVEGGLPPADVALLQALPIAATIVGANPDGGLKVLASNNNFWALIKLSNNPRVRRGDFQALANTRVGTFVADFLAGPLEAPGELDLKDGFGATTRFYRITLAPLPRDGDQVRCLVSVVDRTIEVRTERNHRAEMLRDSLTGLPNRVSFTESVEQRLADHAAMVPHHAVLVIDLMRFSRINESMGALTGDELLITFARRLMGTLRSGDVLARTGGNEFAVLVGVSRGVDDAHAAAERILSVLAVPFQLAEIEIRVETAIGIAMMTAGGDADELFRGAQFAVKEAKRSGNAEVYEPTRATEARRRFSIETELRRALERDELHLEYQPLVGLQGGGLVGFEALARWHHPERGWIGPSEFIPVAEESGLILDLGRWAMDRAAAALADWDAAFGQPGRHYMSVNISAIQVARDDVAGVLREALDLYGLAGDRFVLELTESAIVQDPARAARLFAQLDDFGSLLAVDDFGTGYSSLAYLQKLPIDILKIDKSFVSGMIGDMDKVAIVRAILSLAEALGMKTTAEGIESIELATTMAALGCTTGQGYHFCRPLTATQAVEYLQAQR